MTPFPEPSTGGTWHVLVVDDHPGNRQLIGVYMQAAGLSDISYAADGVEALEAIAQRPPDLVVLDIMMPRMDGFELCRRLRADPRHARLPILVQTALSDPKDRTAAFQAGATDVVTKPVHGPELLARARLLLENRRLIQDLEDYNARVARELATARALQTSLQPSAWELAALAAGAGIILDSHFQTCNELGGDCWGASALPDGRLAIYLADFTGHGIGAAINTARLHTLIHEMQPPDDAADAVRSLNLRLTSLLDTGQFATMLYALFDPATRALNYASAGAPEPCVVDVNGQSRFLPADGLPLGISANATYESHHLVLPNAGAVLFYSDGLSEAENPRDGMLGDDGVARLAGDAWAADNRTHPLHPLLTRLDAFAPSPLRDDITLLWMRWPA